MSGKFAQKDNSKAKLKQSKSFKKGSSALLGTLKEEHTKEEKAGVVPKNLNYGLIKDLILDDNWTVAEVVK